MGSEQLGRPSMALFILILADVVCLWLGVCLKRSERVPPAGNRHEERIRAQQ